MRGIPNISGARIILAWENPDPTSSFSATNFELPTDDFDMYIVCSKSGCAFGLNMQNGIARLVEEGSSGGVRYFWSRPFEYVKSTHKLYVYDCTKTKISDGTSSVDNATFIPSKIYFVKF